jgi:hypothetical protein
LGGVVLAAVLVVASVGCSTETTGPVPGADLRVLYVGNSLTASNDLPDMVAEIATHDDRETAYAVVVRPGYSLEDHWYNGLEDAIREAAADYVVLQQGPSSLPQNQEHLRSWTERIAPVVEESGGRPVLFMVWPSRSRIFAFDAVRNSYRNAASAVDGLFSPAGEVWRSVWEASDGIGLYGPDGFHPDRAGTFAAALTIYGTLTAADGATLPCPDLPELEGVLTDDDREIVCEAAGATLATFAR